MVKPALTATVRAPMRPASKAPAVRDGLQVWLGESQVGSLFHQRGVYSFAYHHAWLRSPQRFWLDPELQLFTGEQYPASEGNFGVFLDSAPDRWGRLLMERREQLDAKAERRAVRVLREWDFLCGVQDITRMGALRFCLPPAQGGDAAPKDDDFIDNQLRAAPPITSLAALHAISHAVEADDWQSTSLFSSDSSDNLSPPSTESTPSTQAQRQWLAQLVAPGSSLGGARPKANFTHTDGSLWIAKFPSREDRRNVAAWEMLLHTLAQQAGITVPPAQLLHLNNSKLGHAGYPTFAVQRFDRFVDAATAPKNGAPAQQHRHLFVSAMTLLQAKDGERHHSYCDLAHFIAQHGAACCVAADLEQLFRRVVFNILTSNRDDHLRNHGFIRQPSGWRLSPAFDLNPNPEKYDHALAIAPQGAAPNVASAIATAQHYRLSPTTASAIAQQVAQTVGKWRQQAPALGLSNSDIERMAVAFTENSDAP